MNEKKSGHSICLTEDDLILDVKKNFNFTPQNNFKAIETVMFWLRIFYYYNKCSGCYIQCFYKSCMDNNE